MAFGLLKIGGFKRCARLVALLRQLGLASLMMTLAACASLEPASQPSASSSNAAASERWSGRFSAIIDNPSANPPRESVSGRFELAQDSNTTLLDLISPLGQVLARVSLKPGEARIESADRGSFTATDAEALTEQVLGWRIPIQHLPRWFQGVAIPVADSRHVFDRQNRLASAEVAGWTLQVREQFSDGRPRRLDLDWKDGRSNTAVTITLRLIIDSN